MQTKTCTKCGQEKEITEFYKSKGGKFGVRSDCKLCHKELQKEYKQRPEVKERKKEYDQTPEIKEYQKEYRQRPDVKERQKEYGQTPEYKEYHKEYDQTPERKEYQKEYNQRPDVKERQKEYQKEYQQRPEYKEYHKEYKNKKYNTDPIFKFNECLKGITSRLFKGKKSAHTEELLGCSKEDAQKWIISLFQPGMTLKNLGKGKGKWNIDHIRPLASFDYKKHPELRYQAGNWRNLQPLWEKDNLPKNDKWDGTEENLTYACQVISPAKKRKMIKQFEQYLKNKEQ
mgnify:CR=1 FL=1